jgi:hypothetical protein
MTAASMSVLQGFDQYDYTRREEGEDDTSTRSDNGDGDGDGDVVYKFTPKYQSSTKNNPLCGICLPEWFRILQQRHHQIDWTTYWPRLVVITLLSLLNSVLAIPEYLFFERRIQSTIIHPRPIFILGHPRTGTTLLHSLLALDEAHFSICTTFCSGFPSCFLWFESIGKTLFASVMDDTRPMDNVALHFDLPQEDELATNVLSAGTSPYLALFFMQQEPTFRPYFAFDDDCIHKCTTTATRMAGDEALPPDQMAAARKTWTTSFLYLLKKLTLRSQLREQSPSTPRNKPRRLILKSPVHTARIPLLLQLFPDAQFLYIHRHPYEVFRSAAHMADTTYWYTYLNTPTNDQIMEFILRQYEILWDRYEEGRNLLKTDQLVEVSFDEISQHPIETVERIYETLEWKLSTDYRERLREELKDVHSCYQRNQHKVLAPSLQKLVQQRWGPSFDRWGYQK